MVIFSLVYGLVVDSGGYGLVGRQGEYRDLFLAGLFLLDWSAWSYRISNFPSLAHNAPSNLRLDPTQIPRKDREENAPGNIPKLHHPSHNPPILPNLQPRMRRLPPGPHANLVRRLDMGGWIRVYSRKPGLGGSVLAHCDCFHLRHDVVLQCGDAAGVSDGAASNVAAFAWAGSSTRVETHTSDYVALYFDVLFVLGYAD
mmetsp:Transcript_27410/g.49430  ORF Transcript_27410/g.49430 Transcript_27410/m.49430 type:complete len:200 (+) Transcript_27410:357-956(+)